MCIQNGRFVYTIWPAGACGDGDSATRPTLSPSRLETPAALRSDLANRTAVAGQLFVGGEERNPLDQRLREQQPVERVFVEWRKRVDVHGVLTGDRKLNVTVVEQATTEDARLDAKVVAPEAGLDGDLPETGGAEEQLVVGIVQLPVARIDRRSG